MRSANSVRSENRGLFSRRGGRLALIAGCALAPLATMAVVVPSAVAVRAAKAERQATLDELEERARLEASVGGYRDAASIRSVVQLRQALDGLVPHRLRPLDEFGEIRSVAAGLGVRLRSIRLVRTHSVGLTADGSPSDGTSHDVSIDEVMVAAPIGLDESIDLIDELRSHGMPIVVLGFDISRPRVSDPTFRSELRLGFLRRSSTR